MKTALEFLVRGCVIAVVVAAFVRVPYAWISLKTQTILSGVVLTLVFGRFFCRSLCPLGLVQSAVNWLCHPKRHVRRVCTRLPETKAQRLVRWTFAAAFAALWAVGLGGLAMTVDPIAVFGRAVTLWWPGVAVFALVAALAAVGRGRVWCNWVCPAGTVYALLARVALVKDKVGAGCGNCRRCFPQATPSEPSGRAAPTGQADGVTRRETLKGVSVLAAAETLAADDKLTDGGYADVSLPGVPDRGYDVLPPGAGDRGDFRRACVGCQLCVANCPGDCLKPSVRLATFGQPVLDFRTGYCLEGCVTCSTVCPYGALAPLQREQRPNVHMGQAVWKKDLCVRTTTGDPCTACVRKCPVQAIHLVKGFPGVAQAKCIGCGACEHVCPARPMPAVYVQGFARQRIVNPISESDLLAEMRAKIDAGAAVVVARGGVIVASESGRGIDPLLRLHDAGRLAGAVVMDKVVGRAAAAICAAGGAKKVFALMAGRGAAELLAARGVPLQAEKTVDAILNRKQDGRCPMETAVSGIEDPQKMIEAIRKAMKK